MGNASAELAALVALLLIGVFVVLQGWTGGVRVVPADLAPSCTACGRPLDGGAQ